MSAPDTELRRAAASLEIVRTQMDTLARQAETLQVAYEDVVRARETLQRAHEAGAGREALVPIGANSFIIGEIRDADRVIVGIGSDVAIEETVPAAVSRLEARAKAIQEAEQGLAERMAQLDAQAEGFNRRIQELYDKGVGGANG